METEIENILSNEEYFIKRKDKYYFKNNKESLIVTYKAITMHEYQILKEFI